jgi:hypothetical protein
MPKRTAGVPLSVVPAKGTDEAKEPQESWYVGARDAQGHSARLWFTAQPGHARDLNSIVASKKFPYRTVGDVLRHALHRHLKWLYTQGRFRSVMGQVELLVEICREEDFAMEMRKSVEQMAAILNKHVSNGNTGQAIRFYLKALGAVRGMPDGFWKDKYKTELQSRFGHLLKGKRVNMLDVDESPEPEEDED